jgi:hypothetical protein
MEGAAKAAAAGEQRGKAAARADDAAASLASATGALACGLAHSGKSLGVSSEKATAFDATGPEQVPMVSVGSDQVATAAGGAADVGDMQGALQGIRAAAAAQAAVKGCSARREQCSSSTLYSPCVLSLSNGRYLLKRKAVQEGERSRKRVKVKLRAMQAAVGDTLRAGPGLTCPLLSLTCSNLH